MKKYKKCKGINKAHGFIGCGKDVEADTRKYGLCVFCFREWVAKTEEGDLWLKKLTEQLRKNRKKSLKKQWKAKKTKTKKQLETKGQLEKKLQSEVNRIVRYIDKGHECISSGRSLGHQVGKYDAGHLFTTNANPTIRFNLFNIYGQSVHDNRDKSGNELEYFIRLEKVFGKELQDFVLSLKKCPELHLTKEDLREKIKVARSLVKWIKDNDRTYTLKERLSLRNDLNEALGIYKKPFLKFEQ